MPWKVVKVQGGWKIKKDAKGGKYMSKEPMSKEKAEAQKRALYALADR